MKKLILLLVVFCLFAVQTISLARTCETCSGYSDWNGGEGVPPGCPSIIDQRTLGDCVYNPSGSCYEGSYSTIRTRTFSPHIPFSEGVLCNVQFAVCLNGCLALGNPEDMSLAICTNQYNACLDEHTLCELTNSVRSYNQNGCID